MTGQTAFRFIPATGPAALIAEGVWSLRLPAVTGPLIQAVAPDGRCEIIFHLGSPPGAGTRTGFERQPEAFLYGPLDRALVLRRERRLHMRAIRLTPWGIGALTRGAQAMAGLAVSIRDALADTGARLEEAAREHDALEMFANSAFALLLERASRLDALPPPAFIGLMQPPGLTSLPSLEALIEASGLTRRTFERRFAAVSGLAPGSWLRICRFQQARTQVVDGHHALADIALEAGYADQAHMTRDFQRYEAVSPAALRRERGSFSPIYAAET